MDNDVVYIDFEADELPRPAWSVPCLDDQEPISLEPWASYQANNIVQVPHENLAGRTWCFDKQNLQNYLQGPDPLAENKNPRTNQPWTQAQRQVLMQQGLLPNADDFLVPDEGPVMFGIVPLLGEDIDGPPNIVEGPGQILEFSIR